jgi:hypothetical protein
MLSVPMWLLTALRSRLICTVPIVAGAQHLADEEGLRRLAHGARWRDQPASLPAHVVEQARQAARIGRACRTQRPAPPVGGRSRLRFHVGHHAPCSIGPSVQT